MKNRDIYRIKEGLEAAVEISKGKMFYGFSKNLREIEDDFELLEKMKEFSKEYKEYEKERIELLEKLSEKDADAKPIKNPDGTYKVNMALFNKEHDKLKEKHKSAIEEREKQIEIFIEFLREENKGFKPFMIKLDDLPEDFPGGIANKIFEVIEL